MDAKMMPAPVPHRGLGALLPRVAREHRGLCQGDSVRVGHGFREGREHGSRVHGLGVLRVEPVDDRRRITALEAPAVRV